MNKSALKKMSTLFETAQYCHSILPFWRPGYLKVLSRACHICRTGRFEPYEAFRLGLFQPNFPDSQIKNYTSRKNTTKLQKLLNPVSWEPLLRDKGLFYRYLMALKLPMPKLYAIFFQKVPGWSPQGSMPAGRAEWEQFLAKIPAEEFVIKPCRSAFGTAVKIFQRTADGFTDTDKKIFNVTNIYNMMRTEQRFDSFVIQERLRNHPEIRRLSPSEFLQTVRVTTFIDRNGCCRILFAFFKLIGSNNITDNFGDGRNGNMLAAVRTDNGRLEPAVITAPDGKGAIYFQKHPFTNIEFESFEIPFWADIIALAKKTAVQFLPLRTIGWDIAVTSEGPKIIEGNMWWNPLNRRQWKNIIEADLPYNL